MNAAELAKGLLRIIGFLPELLGLYEAVEQSDSHLIALKQAKLIRAMQDQRAKEQIGG